MPHRVAAVLALMGACGACGAGAEAVHVAPDAARPSDAALSPDATLARRDAMPGAKAAADGGTIARAFGATVTPGGVVFRVWAPDAKAARVSGDFAAGLVVLPEEAKGVFAALVSTARAGSVYRFVFDSAVGTVTRTDPYCRELHGSDCTVIDPSTYAWKTQGFVRPKLTEAVVYELYVGSFGAAANATTADGTLAGTAARLPELAALGVNVIELMPVHDYGGHNRWGYNPLLWLAPYPGYGHADDLRAFVDQAHAAGIAVWLDVVYNHYDGNAQDPLVCYDGPCDGGPSGQYFFPAGPYAETPYGPRPDFARPEVAAMLEASVSEWLLEYRGDGFRWDSTSNIRGVNGEGTVPGGRSLLVRGNAVAHEHGATSVAEDLKGLATITAPADTGGFGFDAQWDGFGYDVTSVLTASTDAQRDLGTIARVLGGNYNGDPFQRVIFTEDHDTVGNDGARLPNKIDPADPTSLKARQGSMLGAALLLTAPGVPMIFMGQEFLATGTFPAVPPPLPAPTALGREVATFYADLVRLRRNTAGGTGGLTDAKVDVFHENDVAKVLAYRRYGSSGEDVVVVANFSAKAFASYSIGAPQAGAWRIRLDTANPAYGSDLPQGPLGTVTATASPRDGQPGTLTLPLPPYAAIVLSR